MTSIWTFANTDSFGDLTVSLHATEYDAQVSLAQMIVDNDLDSRFSIDELLDVPSTADLLIVLGDVLPRMVARIEEHHADYLLNALEMSAQGVGKPHLYNPAFPGDSCTDECVDTHPDHQEMRNDDGDVIA